MIFQIASLGGEGIGPWGCWRVDVFPHFLTHGLCSCGMPVSYRLSGAGGVWTSTVVPVPPLVEVRKLDPPDLDLGATVAPAPGGHCRRATSGLQSSLTRGLKSSKHSREISEMEVPRTAVCSTIFSEEHLGTFHTISLLFYSLVLIY